MQEEGVVCFFRARYPCTGGVCCVFPMIEVPLCRRRAWCVSFERGTPVQAEGVAWSTFPSLVRPHTLLGVDLKEKAWQRRAPSQGLRPSAEMWRLLPSLGKAPERKI